MNGQSLNGKIFKVSTAYLKPKEEGTEEYDEVEGLLLLRQKLYTQYYSSLNDPLVKAEYEKQILKTFGNEESKKLTIKQSLESVGSLSYAESRKSEYLLNLVPKSVENRRRMAVEERIYQ